jgi:uncharacterized membrane protein
VAAALRADPFDPAAFEAALVARRAAQAEIARRGGTVLSGFVAGLSPEDRAALADRMERRRGAER